VATGAFRVNLRALLAEESQCRCWKNNRRRTGCIGCAHHAVEIKFVIIEKSPAFSEDCSSNKHHESRKKNQSKGNGLHAIFSDTLFTIHRRSFPKRSVGISDIDFLVEIRTKVPR
jgi:hypothetical protein